MKNEMTLSAKTIRTRNTGISRIALVAVVARLLAPLAGYYSEVLGTKVTIRHTLQLLNAQVAFVLTVLPTDGPLLLRLVCLAWLVSALLKCRGASIRTSH